ncbi:bifunctional DNA-formamidopyrimidine glycosylase/DNA-(apurinic or apyrimidinic site) lyase [Roseospira marina]|uniref:Formamidopyrimidine-DNA glycosylase n=1 Tax=Roseospira marina TaxID=140057 RepID=A0A5M6IG06_9PROT|nr:bifunctional DNA-formamidopyrimidine glycosylase/DNA-(apurinic or apyrimidinic site) lyase [Roseospira marina]KAA5607236.1 bifunctional DNA-formamidopyrimidine glycosylase/DNA-(apurinic or apyrimidinic site) lyase [Roseospira marina]MBB4312612.1 formamidopyrimidine-DNA glycosylase [Roseospira marina]MBB5085372.1 formamidopyrimidine-DNA glycosylase [Roseospira marina]
MPELPEVETVRRGLIPILGDRVLTRVLVRQPMLRWPVPRDFAQALTGRRVVALGRRAKYLLMYLDDGSVVIAHLGMSGSLAVRPEGPPEPHDHVLFDTDEGRRVTYHDPRRFGSLHLTTAAALPEHPLLAHLGPEPLDPDLDGNALAARLAGKRCTIKAALLDQRVVAGLGNIYVCESLFHAGLSPRRLAGTVSGERADRLATAIKTVLLAALESGGSTLRDHRQPNGKLGYFQHTFSVYGKEGKPCPGCACDLARTGGVQRLVQTGRSTFYCAHRQR